MVQQVTIKSVRQIPEWFLPNISLYVAKLEKVLFLNNYDFKNSSLSHT